MVEPVKVEEIEVVGLEAGEAGVERAQDGVRVTIGAAPGPVEQDAGFRSEEEFIAAVAQRCADQLLVPAGRINIGGIDMGITEIKRAVEQTRAILG